MIHRLLYVAFILLMASVPVSAQPGSIGVFANASATIVDIDDSVPGLLNVYVVHVSSPGATAAQFSIPHPWCFTATYLAEAVTAPYIQIGMVRTGTAIAYGACMASPNMILTISYFAQNSTPNCCCIYVMPDPSAYPQEVLVTDCSEPPNLLVASGGIGVVNQDHTCDWCSPVNGGCINEPPVPVEDTSWGAIKALYSN